MKLDTEKLIELVTEISYLSIKLETNPTKQAQWAVNRAIAILRLQVDELRKVSLGSKENQKSKKAQLNLF